MNVDDIEEYRYWCRKEINLARERGYLSDEGIYRHLKEHSGAFNVTKSTAEQIINHLMSLKA